MPENDQTSAPTEIPQSSEISEVNIDLDIPPAEISQINIDLDIPSAEMDFGDYVKDMPIQQPTESEE